jgi:hypothetical protein
MYAMDAMIAGPANRSADRGPLRVPSKKSAAPRRVLALKEFSAEYLVMPNPLMRRTAHEYVAMATIKARGTKLMQSDFGPSS